MTDGFNVPRQLTDTGGEVTLSVRYNPWGKPIETNGIGNFDASYIGTLIDATTGLIYIGNGQYYDPETGRFLTRGVFPNNTNPYVPWNPTGMLLGPLGLVSLFSSQKKGKSKGRNRAVLIAILVLAMANLACCHVSPPDPTPGPDTTGGGTGTPPPTTTPPPTGTGQPPVNPPGGPPCEGDDCTPTPGPMPTVTKTIFFGGSGGSLDLPGPDPYYQTKVWADSATQVVRFPGGGRQGKPNQANDVDINTYKDVNLIVIGYSAGGDTALIFADKYRNYQQTNNGGTGKITDIAVLGGTMTGLMTDGRDLAQEWPGVLNNLLMWGTDIYILDDKADGGGQAGGHVVPSNATGTFHFEQRLEQEHWDGGYPYGEGTNNSVAFKNEVYTWFDAH